MTHSRTWQAQPQANRTGLQAAGSWFVQARRDRVNAATAIVETDAKGYAFPMSKKPDPSRRARDSQLKLLALLLYVAEQKQKSQDIMKHLFRRLMLPNKD